MNLPARRGEIWQADLNRTRGPEQRGVRRVLVLSVDQFNDGPSGLVIVAPLTTTARNIPVHIPIAPPQGGLTRLSYILCDGIRSISRERLTQRSGVVERGVLREVEHALAVLLGL